MVAGVTIYWTFTESTLIEKIWLELAELVGCKLALYASAHPESGTHILRRRFIGPVGT
jgi:Ni,Fe-hydrogenase I small subunit